MNQSFVIQPPFLKLEDARIGVVGLGYVGRWRH